MFGYVLPRSDRLTEAALQRYKAAYCGLCHSLRLHYGFRARFLVNYDMTFLYFLLSEQEQSSTQRCFCPARIVCRKDCLPEDEIFHYAADLSVLLSYWKLRDARADGGFWKGLGARIALWLYRRPYRRAAKRQPEADAVFSEQLKRLQKLEDSRCGSIDRVADAFASLLRACTATELCPTRQRILQQLLYHVGRYLYLVDALEDLPKDLRRGSYNPLQYRYCLTEGALSGEDREQLMDTIEASISMAASALELLDPKANEEILRNIIYYGLPTVLKRVANGSFRQRRRNK